MDDYEQAFGRWLHQRQTSVLSLRLKPLKERVYRHQFAQQRVMRKPTSATPKCPRSNSPPQPRNYFREAHKASCADKSTNLKLHRLDLHFQTHIHLKNLCRTVSLNALLIIRRAHSLRLARVKTIESAKKKVIADKLTHALSRRHKTRARSLKRTPKQTKKRVKMMIQREYCTNQQVSLAQYLGNMILLLKTPVHTQHVYPPMRQLQREKCQLKISYQTGHYTLLAAWKDSRPK